MSSAEHAVAAAAGRVESRSLAGWLWRLVPAVVFILSMAFTEPPFIGDSVAYCEDVARVLGRLAPASALWEPGHILWRPLAWLLSPLFLAGIPNDLAWTPTLKIGYGLMLLNVLCGLAIALSIYDLSCRWMRSRAAALIPVVLFVWGDAVLAYSHSSAAYIVGLAPLVAGIYWQVRWPGRGSLSVIGPAVLFGAAALFWLPYAIAIPAACCAGRFLPSANGAAQRGSFLRMTVTAMAAGVVVAAGFAMAALLAGVRSLPQARFWLVSAGHGLQQNHRAARAVTGCTRILADLAEGGVYLKRFLFHDPYHSVGAAGLVAHVLWRPAAVYVFVAALVVLAWRSRGGRNALVLLALSGLPALAAAILVFEPSAPERFLPVLPFLLLAVAAGWNAAGRAAQWLRAVICCFALLLPLMNAPQFIGALSGWRQQAQQVTAFRAAAAPGDALVGVVISEPLVDLPTQHPFDALNRAGEIPTIWAVDLMAGQAAQWPVRVARFVLANWAKNRAVWVEKAALADRPADRLLWVEGDNPAVHWQDVPRFFRGLPFDRDSGEADGFARIRHSAAVEAQLRSIAGAN